MVKERMVPAWLIVLVVLIAIGLAGWLLYRFAGTSNQPAVQEQPPARPPELPVRQP